MSGIPNNKLLLAAGLNLLLLSLVACDSSLGLPGDGSIGPGGSGSSDGGTSDGDGGDGGDDAFGDGIDDGSGDASGPGSTGGCSGSDGSSLPQCAAVATLQCDSVVSGDTSDPNGGSSYEIEHYPEFVGNYSGPEVGYLFVAPSGGEVRLRLLGADPQVNDQDIIVLEANSPCHSDYAQQRGFNSMIIDVQAGASYFILVDGFDGDAGAFQLELSCELEEATADPGPNPGDGSDPGPGAPLGNTASGPATAPANGAVAFPTGLDLLLPFAAGEQIRVGSGYGPGGGSSLHSGLDRTGSANDHYALDLLSNTRPNSGHGMPIVAPIGGVVVKAGWASSGWANYGLRVILRHDVGDGHTYHSLYAHLSEISVSEGQWLDQGERLGLMGRSCQGAQSCSSFSTPHVHFSMHRNSSVGGSGSGSSYGGRAVVPEALDGATHIHQGMILTSSN
jgi:murein DD-endopeptidase MepM/ murein hydrolase activator NlpD